MKWLYAIIILVVASQIYLIQEWVSILFLATVMLAPPAFVGYAVWTRLRRE